MGDGPALAEAAAAGQLLTGIVRERLRLIHVGTGLGEACLVSGELRFRLSQFCLGGIQVRFRLFDQRHGIARVELHQQISALHDLVVVHENTQHFLRYLRAHLHDMRLDERVVGGLAAPALEKHLPPPTQRDQ